MMKPEIAALPVIVGLLMTAVGIGQAAGAEPVPVSPSPADDIHGSVEMEIVGRHPVVMVELNGRGPYRFIVDTGAAVSVIDSSLANELELPVVGETDLMSPAGGTPVESSLVSIDDLAMSTAVFRKVQAATMDLSSLFRSPDAPRGVLSASLFGGLLLTFDYPRSRISFEKGALGPADGSEIFEYDAGGGLPVIPVSLAGVIVDFHLDTGSRSGFTLPGSYQDTLPLLSPPVETGRVHLVGREVVEYGSRLNGVATFGRYAFANPEIRFIDALPMGNIGYEILRQFTVTMDSANRRLKMERSTEAPALPASRPRRYGVRFFDLEASPLQVAGVDGDSVAAEAGLQSGDRIAKMNGKPVESLNATERIAMLRGSVLALEVERGGRIIEIRMSLE
jgi:hypothetical protein